MNRRSFFGFLGGIGALGLAGVALQDMAEPGSVSAARRPTPTPRPVTCPGAQTPVGGVCQCVQPKAPGPYKCGPDCCGSAAQCCDNACCLAGFVCGPEEICIPAA
jgi:hypothetical protein